MNANFDPHFQYKGQWKIIIEGEYLQQNIRYDENDTLFLIHKRYWIKIEM